MDKETYIEILKETINDLKTNPNFCTENYGESHRGIQLQKFVEYLHYNHLINKNYVKNFKKIKNKQIKDYSSLDETLTAFTKIIRGDRFISGELYYCFKEGYLLEVLEKMLSFVDIN